MWFEWCKMAIIFQKFTKIYQKGPQTTICDTLELHQFAQDAAHSETFFDQINFNFNSSPLS